MPSESTLVRILRRESRQRFGLKAQVVPSVKPLRACSRVIPSSEIGVKTYLLPFSQPDSYEIQDVPEGKPSKRIFPSFWPPRIVPIFFGFTSLTSFEFSVPDVFIGVDVINGTGFIDQNRRKLRIRH